MRWIVTVSPTTDSGDSQQGETVMYLVSEWKIMVGHPTPVNLSCGRICGIPLIADLPTLLSNWRLDLLICPPATGWTTPLTQ
jgi:hypothetical protein